MTAHPTYSGCGLQPDRHGCFHGFDESAHQSPEVSHARGTVDDNFFPVEFNLIRMAGRTGHSEPFVGNFLVVRIPMVFVGNFKTVQAPPPPGIDSLEYQTWSLVNPMGSASRFRGVSP